MKRKDRTYLIIKRIMDISLSVSLLILTSPLFLFIMLLIKLTSKGPVFYKSLRVGLHGRLFYLYKFRTMVNNAERILEENEHLWREYSRNGKLKNDPRVTKIGRFLRKLSLDELPQFLNVLKGDMSIVGPRPVVVQEIHKYGRWQKEVLSVKPGITGYWQVSGRAEIPYPQRIDYDLFYVRNKSIFFDIEILLKTPIAMITGKGAY